MTNNENLLKQISKELYGDELYIEKAVFCYQAQQEKIYTFFKDNTTNDLLKKYNWCQRPCDTNMSLCQFDKNANVYGWMSESFAARDGLEQITLNDFIYDFVQPMLEENIKLKELLKDD